MRHALQLTVNHKQSLSLQKAICFINFPWFGSLWFFLIFGLGGYSCRDIISIRKKAVKLLDEVGSKPLVICANHLTMIDSMLITTFLFPFSSIFKRFTLMPWNVPEVINFGKNFLLRLMCYLGKCVYVERGGSLASKKLTLEKVKWLVKKKQLVCLFPEGTRSRTGKIDPESATYGIGKILQEVEDCHVLCVYVRGDDQESYSFLPKRNETFYTDISLIKPTSEHKGNRGAKEITLEVMNQLKDMEHGYFQSIGK